MSSPLAKFLLFSLLQTMAYAAPKKSYIVYLGKHPHGLDGSSEDFDRAAANHYALLASFLGSAEEAHAAITYSYTKSINGFVANLDEYEAKKLAKWPGVVSVFPNKRNRKHTTRSWEFLGIEKDGQIPESSIWSRARFGRDVIIANLDSGVWPESESFNDRGLGPVPSRWKGFCQKSSNPNHTVTCNRKLIGARYFNTNGYSGDEFSSPRDFDGHGTHTLSTAGGSFVPNVSLFGVMNGTAKGGAPGARVAAYKVGHGDIFEDSDVMAGFDAAIYDGVDVISLSLSGDSAWMDLISAIGIGSFHAVQSGIPVVCSAGNDGPGTYSVLNTEPWVLTVGEASSGRLFFSDVTLGDGRNLEGWSLAEGRMPNGKFFPVVHPREAKSPGVDDYDAERCNPRSLDPSKVKGKIVVCLGGSDRWTKSQQVSEAGGAGMILVNTAEWGGYLSYDYYTIPALHLNYTSGLAVYSYLNSTRSPTAHIGAPTARIVKPEPEVCAQSGRGPGYRNSQLLKPDVIAPAISILAAYSPAKVIESRIPNESRRLPYFMLSGTSMACPHVAGVVALLKAMYPHWSPAALKSAIMTTATIQDNTGGPILDAVTNDDATPFDTGSGFLQPNPAMDPGLVYDVTTEDYLRFLCVSGIESFQVQMFAGGKFRCPPEAVKIEDLNLPSIGVADLKMPINVTRTLKNVGAPGTYHAHIQPPQGVTISVEPATLDFKTTGEEKTFWVVLAPEGGKPPSKLVHGQLTWSDGSHTVRSPITVAISLSR
ncbi:unnamed protein product [Spirodela intermedia]|uniref:Uncharacterized protein n=1 Tax=Spirodela intermedia TaxID=51605 RepID=A0A7I8KBQ1_SPIIN|nr:unnamed protein product [Spirodela intermedia]